MKAKKIVYITGAVVCITLTIIIRTASLPFELVRDALDAVADSSENAADRLLALSKSKK